MNFLYCLLYDEIRDPKGSRKEERIEEVAIKYSGGRNGQQTRAVDRFFTHMPSVPHDEGWASPV